MDTELASTPSMNARPASRVPPAARDSFHSKSFLFRNSYAVNLIAGLLTRTREGTVPDHSPERPSLDQILISPSFQGKREAI